MDSGAPRGQPGPQRRQATELETVEDVRSQIRATSKTVPEVSPVTRAEGAAKVRAFRPSLRPPMGLLHVFDDGEDTGEVVRVRASSFIIGRVEGDLVIPHDGGISGRHAEIVRRVENGTTAWFLRDLNSTNGTFVRASTVILHHDQEVLIGAIAFRFTVPGQGSEAADLQAPEGNATRKWEGLSRADAARSSSSPPPTLTEVAKGGMELSFPLTQGEHWLGSDPRQCSMVIDDPTVDPRHARIYRDDHDRWVMANERSRNGLWARVQEVGLGRGGYFQCGEQRFLFKVL
jgi:hypothetical protein